MAEGYVRSKIVCTIGPASDAPETIDAMIKAGMDVARLNLSHGTYDEHREKIGHIRDLGDIGILVDLPGPKIRLGEIEGTIYLEQGKLVHFTTRDVIGREGELPVSYDKLPRELNIGGSVYLSDGLIEVEVTDIDPDLNGFTAKVVSEGEVTSRKGINAPGAKLSLRPPTDKDVEGIDFGIEMGADWFAVSFVRDSRDLEETRRMIKDAGGSQPIISKIEHGEAIDNIEGIIESSDGVMVARGDLGIEVKPWEVPLLQKKIINKCREAGKPVIVATQMLESMVTHPRPTRAEASDVANAIIDGADAVMLSEETATGLFPVEAVRVMNSISQTVESSRPSRGMQSLSRSAEIADVIGSLTSQAAGSVDPAAIIVVTRSGFSALMVSKHRPKGRILAVTRDLAIRRMMKLFWGVETLNIPWTDERDELIVRAIKECLERSLVSLNDAVMVVSGSTLEAPGRTTTLEILKVDNVLEYKKRKED
ncbi:MAG: pyruvate kinase [Candidatus Bathyarchaeia archaeon]